METIDPKNPDNFPTLDFKKCPNPECGSVRRIAHEVAKKLIEEGKLPKGTNAYLYNHQSILAKNMNWLSATMILSYYDACMDCGTVYCIHSEVRIVVQGMEPSAGAGKQFSTS